MATAKTDEAPTEDTTPKEPTKCSVSWCDKPARSNGYCRQHYRRNKRQGSPIAITGDVAALLSLAKEAIAVVGEQAAKLHKASKHSTSFDACQTGLCGTFHSLAAKTQGDVKHE